MTDSAAADSAAADSAAADSAAADSAAEYARRGFCVVENVLWTRATNTISLELAA